jgi:hypothetical protein
MFLVSGAERRTTNATWTARDIARGGGGDAGGNDYDDVAKVGSADRGNFPPGDRAHKENARFGSPL